MNKNFKQDFLKYFRLDETTSLGHSWILLSWIPDCASVRHKMLFASTKATLKTEFGSANIKEDLHATELDEMTYDGYLKFKRNTNAPNPLTNREEEIEEMKKTETKTNYNVDSKERTMGGINFPLTDKSKTALQEFSKGSNNYLQFCIDLDEEKIDLVKEKKISVSNLNSLVPKDHARYHLFIFDHTHEGDYQKAIVFIYTMPGYSCSIKERMLYSSCKVPFTETIKFFGLEITKAIEADDGDELNEEFLLDAIHPKTVAYRPLFAKPKGPSNRGPKRLTRPSAVNN